MRTLEFQVQLNKAEWQESRRAFVSPDQQDRQDQISKALRKATFWGFLIAGCTLVGFAALSPATGPIAQAALVPYGLLLAATLFGPYFLNLFRTRGVVFTFAFMDGGWRYFSNRSQREADKIREWEDLVEWNETKSCFQLAYLESVGAGKRVLSALNAPLVGGAAHASGVKHALIPKRALTKPQILEVRSILNATVRKTVFTDD